MQKMTRTLALLLFGAFLVFACSAPKNSQSTASASGDRVVLDTFADLQILRSALS